RPPRSATAGTARLCHRPPPATLPGRRTPSPPTIHGCLSRSRRPIRPEPCRSAPRVEILLLLVQPLLPLPADGAPARVIPARRRHRPLLPRARPADHGRHGDRDRLLSLGDPRRLLRHGPGLGVDYYVPVGGRARGLQSPGRLDAEPSRPRHNATALAGR